MDSRITSISMDTDFNVIDRIPAARAPGEGAGVYQIINAPQTDDCLFKRLFFFRAGEIEAGPENTK